MIPESYKYPGFPIRISALSTMLWAAGRNAFSSQKAQPFKATPNQKLAQSKQRKGGLKTRAFQAAEGQDPDQLRPKKNHPSATLSNFLFFREALDGSKLFFCFIIKFQCDMKKSERKRGKAFHEGTREAFLKEEKHHYWKLQCQPKGRGARRMPWDVGPEPKLLSEEKQPEELREIVVVVSDASEKKEGKEIEMIVLDKKN